MQAHIGGPCSVMRVLGVLGIVGLIILAIPQLSQDTGFTLSMQFTKVLQTWTVAQSVDAS